MSAYLVALEAQLTQCRDVQSRGLLGHGLEELRRGDFQGAWKKQHDPAMVRTMLATLSGDAYFWSEQVQSVIGAAAENMPPWVLIESALPASAGFFWFEREMAVPSQPRMRMQAISWVVAHGTQVHLAFWESPMRDQVDDAGLDVTTLQRRLAAIRGPLARICYQGMTWQIGQTLDEVDQVCETAPTVAEDAKKELMEQCRIFAACLAFLQQEIFVASYRRADRATRRRWARALSYEPAIRVVELRRKRHDEPREPGEPREWSCQWVVRGHWRQQWYPSLQRNQPRWILPYVKGPEDAPLKVPKPTVFAVVR